MHDTRCVNPHIHLAVEPSGRVIPCCVSVDHYNTDSGSKTIAQEPIINFWNSTDRQKLIKQLESGKQAPGCKYCWREEAAGKVSKRMRDNEEWKHVQISKDQQPVYIYLALGNLCNLKCRICGPDRSSVFADEESKISWFNNTQMKLFNDPIAARRSFDADNENFWGNILTMLSQVKRLDFSGGEPFYVKNHWKIIKHVVSNGWSSDQFLHYNTNSTIFPEQYIGLLEMFKAVDICISIDGVDKEFEYIRHPANFDEAERTIERFCQVRDHSKIQWSIQATVSVSAFSIWNFANTYEYCRDKSLSIYVNFVHDNRSIKFFPRELKNTLIKRLQAHSSKYPE